MAPKKAKKSAVKKSGAKKSVKKSSSRAKPVRAVRSVARPVVSAPVKPKKNYKLPNYKKKCIECAQFKFIKGGWSLCMQCYEKRYGRYHGEDRFLYANQ